MVLLSEFGAPPLRLNYKPQHIRGNKIGARYMDWPRRPNKCMGCMNEGCWKGWQMLLNIVKRGGEPKLFPGWFQSGHAILTCYFQGLFCMSPITFPLGRIWQRVPCPSKCTYMIAKQSHLKLLPARHPPPSTFGITKIHYQISKQGPWPCKHVKYSNGIASKAMRKGPLVRLTSEDCIQDTKNPHIGQKWPHLSCDEVERGNRTST